MLQIAKRTVNEIKKQKGFDAFLIRDGDYYLGHRKRTALAREKRATFSYRFTRMRSSKHRYQAHRFIRCLIEVLPVKQPNGWLSENQSDMLGGVGNVSLDDKDPMLAQVLRTCR